MTIAIYRIVLLLHTNFKYNQISEYCMLATRSSNDNCGGGLEMRLLHVLLLCKHNVRASELCA